MKTKLTALLLALALCLTLAPAAAAYTEIEDAKDALGSVDIAQFCNGTESDNYTHNYATDGDELTIDYHPSLRMTEEMALYLCPRQSQLLNAKFNVHVMIDTKVLEFADTGDKLTVIFTSMFLKPWDVDADDHRQYPGAFSDYKAGNYSSTLLSYVDGVFTYEISVDKAWAQTYAADHGYIDIPMELIVYFDEANSIAYSYEDLFTGSGTVKSQFAGKKPLYADFTKEQWMSLVSADLKMKVRDDARAAITGDPSTWKYVFASGTIDGEFTYERWHQISTISDYVHATHTETLEFGNDFATDSSQIIEEWTSNEVRLQLINCPDSSYLNLEDHYAYIIGYPDGMVHPEGNITRAEVATIFFRMLTDGTRNAYWSKTNPYNDVQADDWFNNAVSTLTNLGILNGYEDGGFHPQANITRAEFATIAVRFFVTTEGFNPPRDEFDDIGGSWANRNINMAYLLGIVNGYPDGTYRPDNPINRAEAMTIVNNTLRRTPIKDSVLDVAADMVRWPDNADAAQWYYEAVQEATNSHEYTYFDTTTDEQWTQILPVRDWAAFERAWSEANSAENPGEVVGQEPDAPADGDNRSGQQSGDAASDRDPNGSTTAGPSETAGQN